MKVLLKQNVKGLGQAGEIKNVSDGYAYNFLLPRKVAVPAVSSEAERLSHEFEAKKEQKVLAENKAVEKIKSLNSKTIEFKTRANDQGHLFKAIHEKDIVMELKKRFGVDLASSCIKISAEIKSVGEHKIKIEKGEARADVVILVVKQ